MAIANRMRTEPIPVVRQHRPVQIRTITTVAPGVIAPVSAFGLLRGDSVSGRVNLAVEMSETHEVLFNRMYVRFSAWFVPKVALERFQRNKTFFERSARGEPMTDEEGADVIPFIETMAHPAAATHPVLKSLGVSAKAGTAISTEYQEAYNQLVNYAYRNRSKSLPQRDLDDSSLAKAMWAQSAFSEIVPNFDSGMIAGETPLTIASANLPVEYGAGLKSVPVSLQAGGGAQRMVAVATGNPITATADNIQRNNTAGLVTGTFAANLDPNGSMRTDLTNVYAKLSQNGVSVALANIDQARKLVEWAKMREHFEGHSDPWVIDTLMSGLPVEDQQWFQPWLLDQKLVDVKQLKRMATDGANLEEGVANGVAIGSLGINVPANPFGGTVMIVMEAVPEQLYERQADPYLTTTALDKLPRYDHDVLNPMPVVEVLNKEIDVDHDSPNVRFGYARRNWQWAQNPTRVGGDLFAPNADAETLVERRVIYPTDVENPTLAAEFYLATTLGKSVFVDQVKDPFRVGIGGTLDVMGLTVIGAVHESEANYDAVRAEYAPLPAQG